MGKHIQLNPSDTSHIKYGNLEKPVLPFSLLTTLTASPEEILQAERGSSPTPEHEPSPTAKEAVRRDRYGWPKWKGVSGNGKYDLE